MRIKLCITFLVCIVGVILSASYKDTAATTAKTHEVAVAANQSGNSYINDIGMEFVLIPAGSFDMGSPNNTGVASEKPQHKVTISKSFYLGKYEVTQAQWEGVMGINNFDMPQSNSLYNLPGIKQRLRNPDHPATVSWDDAQEFIRRLNLSTGRNIYRLPTEAEWEYAARAESNTSYFWGEEPAKLAQFAWYGADFISGSTHPVGKKLANKWGLYDIYGNVWEWVQDWYSESYYAKSPELDPLGPNSGTHHVVRGGSWHETGNGWRSASRKAYEPDYRGISIGFRVVMIVNKINE